MLRESPNVTKRIPSDDKISIKHITFPFTDSKAKMLNSNCENDLQIIFTEDEGKVDTSSKIVMLSAVEVLVVVDKEPMAIYVGCIVMVSIVKMHWQ